MKTKIEQLREESNTLQSKLDRFDTNFLLPSMVASSSSFVVVVMQSVDLALHKEVWLK